MNVLGQFPGTSDHSTTSSDESLYLISLMPTADELWAVDDHENVVPPEVYTAAPKARGDEEFPPWMGLRRDLWWPSTGYGYFRIPPGQIPPLGAAYLPASSWEPMVAEAALPEPLHPKPTEPKSPSITLPSQPSIRGASEPASGTPPINGPSAIYASKCLPNFVCKMPFFPVTSFA